MFACIAFYHHIATQKLKYDPVSLLNTQLQKRKEVWFDFITKTLSFAGSGEHNVTEFDITEGDVTIKGNWYNWFWT